MKVAFASEYPADDIRVFSGIPYFMSRALRASCESFVYIQTPSYDFDAVRYDRNKGLQDLKQTGQYLSERLNGMDIDVVVCQGSSMIPFLKTDMPVILWHDATWLALMQMNVERLKREYPLLHEWDQRAMERCDLIAFAADWVCDQAHESYGIPSDKLITLPFGANLINFDPAEVKHGIEVRKPAPCQLAFLGVEWRRKGLELAYAVCRNLNQRGVRSVLNVIGCRVDKIGWKRRTKHFIGVQPFTATETFQIRFPKDPMVNDLGFLKKDQPPDYARLSETLTKSHFLLHPASFECYGIALVEANAFGVPVIATDQYGPRTIIRNGSNGKLFPAEEYVEGATIFIQHYMEDYDQYKDLARNSFIEQQERLDWSRSVQKLRADLVDRGLLVGKARSAAN